MKKKEAEHDLMKSMIVHLGRAERRIESLEKSTADLRDQVIKVKQDLLRIAFK